MARDFTPLINSMSRDALLLALVWVLGFPLAQAQGSGAIYRCGNEYTNSPTPAQKKDCKLLEGGNITVVPATRPVASGNKGSASVPSSPDQPRVDPNQQKARDSDARAILEAELKRAEARLADAQREYNNGQPDKLGLEHRNLGKYNERVADLKAAVTRAEADVAGLKRELSRATGNANAAANPARR